MIYHILIVIGSIGLFLYGMKLMSEGLQKIAGESLRNIHAAMIQNRVSAMFTGILITALVLSSSTTMIMLVSFVNGGLITLAQSLAVVMGSKLGNTILTWIIASLGFKWSISLFILPLIAVALPLFQSNNTQRNSCGEFLIGFALLFGALFLLTDAMGLLTDYPAVEVFLMQSCDYGYLSALLYVVVGIGLTIAVQSSVLTYSFALLLCAQGLLSFEMGCALLVGSNLGSCFTPWLASHKASARARRSAMSFILFNALGTIWVIAVFFLFCDLISLLCSWFGLDPANNVSDISLALAIFHTVFNLINIILMLPFTHHIEKWATVMIKDTTVESGGFKMQYISKGIMSTGEMALLQVRKETSRFADMTYQMYFLLRSMIDEPMGSERQMLLYQQIKQMEEDSDLAEVEIADFLNQIPHKTLSADGELLSRNLYKMVDELESIGDSIFHMSNTLFNKQEQRVFFSKEMNVDIRKMLTLTDTALSHMCNVLSLDEIPGNALNKAYNFEDEINNYRNQLRNAMLDRIDLQQIEYMQSTYFMMLVNECEKIGDYCINVVASACEV